MSRRHHVVWWCLIAASCAEAPDQELHLAAQRVERAREMEAFVYAVEPFALAETALADARRLSDGESYLDALRRAGESVGLADQAYVLARQQKAILTRRVARCIKELEGLLDIARSKGARDQAPEEYEGLSERARAVESLAASGDLPGAYDQGIRLKPELLALEMRFR